MTMNKLIVIEPTTRAVVLTETICTGRDKSARRVTVAVARAAAQGCTVEVLTRRGWVPRFIVKRGSAYYTRTTPDNA